MVKRIKACLNGQRRHDEHPAVPITPAESVADNAELVRLGLAAWRASSGLQSG